MAACSEDTDGGLPNSDAGARDLGMDAGERDLGTEQRDLGTDSGSPDFGMDAGLPDLGMDAGQRDLGMDAGSPDLGDTDAGTACLGSIDRSTSLGSLTPAEVSCLCTYQLSVGPPGEIECGDGITVSPTSQAECVVGLEASTSSCSVDLLLTCMDSVMGDWCGFATMPSAACSAYIDCLLDG